MKNTTYYTENSTDSNLRIKDSNNILSSTKPKDIRKYSRTWNSKNTRCEYDKKQKIINQRNEKALRNNTFLM